MDLCEVLSSLQLQDSAEIIGRGWKGSQAALPSGEIAFLTPGFVRSACRATLIADDVAEHAARVASHIGSRPPLRALAWHLQHAIYRAGRGDWDWLGRWPVLQASLGEDAGMFYLVVLLAGVPRMQEIHRTHAVPESIIRDTLSDFQLWLGPERKRTGQPAGLTGTNVAWLSNHTRGNLYRLGRLQFQFADFHGRLRVYRHQETRAVVALSEEGVGYLDSGQVAQHNDATWTSTLVLDDEQVTGYPISPQGHAVRELISLSLSEWRPALRPGDPVFNLHIPGDGPMTHEACGESFRTALAFFPRRYRNYRFVAFVCGSWILNTWLEDVLPPTSNLVRFQREVYLYPIPLWPPTMIDRAFGKLPEDLSQAPRDTQLRRAILQVLEAGRELPVGGGACFLFPEDFRWGEEVYRRQGLPSRCAAH